MKVSVSIDGVPLEGVHVWPHYQREPWPGGHEFELVLEDKHFAKSLSSSSVDSDAEGTTMFRLGLVLTTAMQSPIRFVLNRISSLTVEGDSVRITGIASPMVKNPPRSGGHTAQVSTLKARPHLASWCLSAATLLIVPALVLSSITLASGEYTGVVLTALTLAAVSVVVLVLGWLWSGRKLVPTILAIVLLPPSAWVFLDGIGRLLASP